MSDPTAYKRPKLNLTGYIRDGYTRQGFIKGIAFKHPDIRFDYRPPQPGDRATVVTQAKKAEPREAEVIAAEAISHYLVWWDLKDESGKTLEFKNAKLFLDFSTGGFVDPVIGQRLWEIIIAGYPSDVDPDWGQETKKEQREDELAFLRKQPDARANTDSGN